MTPETDVELDYLEGIEEEEYEMPSYDFGLNTDNNRINGIVEELEAVKQAIYLILNTERCEYSVYGEDYGVELNDLIGEDTEWVIPELEMRIKEALMMDDRITDVNNFSFETPIPRTILVTFTVETIKGTLDMEKEVEI